MLYIIFENPPLLSKYMAKQRIDAFDFIFLDKLKRVEKHLTKHLNMPKKERNKNFIKSAINEIRSLRKIKKTNLESDEYKLYLKLHKKYGNISEK